VRPSWIQEQSPTDRVASFGPDNDTVEVLMDLWLEKKDAFEARFYASRIPVR
jgi:hypothetical protein